MNLSKKNLLERLIEEVRRRECLYNLKSPDYRKVHKKEEVWKDISKKIGVDVRSCKIKWKSVRDRYRKELVKRDTASAIGMNIEKPWRLFNSLSFLESVGCKKSIHNSGTETESMLSEGNEKEEKYFSSEIPFEEVVDESLDSNMERTTNCDVLCSFAPSPPPPLEFFKQPNIYGNREEIDNLVKNFLNTATESIQAALPAKTAIRVFLESIAMQIDAANVSPFKLLEFQKSVLNAAYEAVKKE